MTDGADDSDDGEGVDRPGDFRNRKGLVVCLLVSGPLSSVRISSLIPP